MFWPDPTHQPTQPPTHQTIHPPMGGEFSTNFKSSNRIEISWLVQVLSNFNWFWWSPLGGGRWVDGGADGVGVCRMSHACKHAHACTSTHTRTCMLNMINMDASMSVAICNFYTCIHVHACMCVSVCVHVHACGDTPHAPRHPHPPAPSPEPQGAQNTKIQ